MPENIKLFRQGGMDADDAVEFIGQEDFVEAYNVRVMGTSEGEEGLATNIESNTLIAGVRPAGLNKAIGAAGFEITRNAYAFVYNSQQKNLMVKLAYDTNTQTTIFENLTNSASVNILPLNTEYYVNDIKLVNDKFLAFTDGNMQPRLINVDKLADGTYISQYGSVTEDDMLIIKAQGLIPVTCEYGNDDGQSVNLLQGKLFQFIYQYVYSENEHSAWSTRSKRPVPAQESTSSVGTNVTKNNHLVVRINIGTNRVKDVNVAARYSNYDWFTIKSASRAYILALPAAINVASEIYEAYDPATNIYSIAFYNDGLYTNIDPLETDLDYDHVPLKCETLENVNGNILALGGITEGYPRPVVDVDIVVSAYDPLINVTLPPTGLTVITTSPEQNNRKALVFSGTPAVNDLIVIRYVKKNDPTNIITLPIPSGFTVTNTNFGLTMNALYVALSPFGYIIDFVDVPGSCVIGINANVGALVGYKFLDCTLTLVGAGAPTFKSIHALKSNSSYQLALLHFDKWGRYFPVVSGKEFVIETPPYAEIKGLTPQISWKINSLPPENAASAQWAITKNNTHQTTLMVNGVLVTPVIDDYLTFNLAPLKKFNEANSSSVLNYEYTPGDRCTLLFYIDGTTYNYFNNPFFDVEVVGFTIDANNGSYLLKIRKAETLNTTAITSKNVMLEIYTPRLRDVVENNATVPAEQLFYEIGDEINIVNNAYQTTTGFIRDGDVYYKTRSLVNAVAPNTPPPYSFLVEDFNFSDFYESAYTSYGRPRSYNDEPGVVERKASIRYSDSFLRDSMVNGLTRFYTDNIYGDIDGESSSNYGWIRKIRQRNNVLVCFQELKVGYIPVSQTLVEDQSSSAQYALSFKLFNFIRYNGKNIGMGNAKESYAEWNNNFYFVDPFRSEPIRAGLDGIEPISGKMSKYFKRVLQQVYEAGKKIIGYYDIFNNEYLLSTETEGDILSTPSFNILNWQLEDDYIIPANAIAITAQGTKGVTTYNSTTGIATYTPNTGETGADSFTFGFTVSGIPRTKNVCINIQAGDICPNNFVFGDVTGASLSTSYTSNVVGIYEINIATPISIVGGEYRINSGSWTSVAGTVNNNDLVEVRQTSSATPSTLTVATLTVGCRVVPFNVTTAGTTTTTTSTTTTTTTLIPPPTTTTTSTTSTTTTSTSTTSTTSTTTTTTYPCICYEVENETGSALDITYTPCASVETTVSVPANYIINICVDNGTPIYATGLTVTNCGIPCTADYDCNNCTTITTTTTTQIPTTTTTTQAPTQISILVVDMYNNTSLDVCAYIDTPGVTPSGNIVSAVGALNFYVPGDAAANAYLLSSDNITPSPSLTRRFEWNINRLHFEYPNQTTYPTFTLQVRGRAASAASVSGEYSLKFPNQTMTMGGSLGSYIPSVTPAGGPAPTLWNSNVISGANGTVGTSVGDLILTFVYVRATNIINVTTY